MIAATFWGIRSEDTMFRLSMATAYSGLALLGGTLLLGPFNVLRSGRSPLSTDLRRDLGIWAALVSLVHVVAGLQVHFRGRPWLYFVAPAELPYQFLSIRLDVFGFANHLGLAAALLAVLLLALSNDLSLRRLGAWRWKMLQRLNYGLLALVVAHGLLYQRLEVRNPRLVMVLVTLTAVVAAVQVAGFWRRRVNRVGPGGDVSPR